ncbi:hypothetical protein BaRGS_00003918 [Batillaria attramentaria]|uniref:Sulfotransferase domain-containing protein n=1 Tax=Batillaria attramentaria TaxID=370345 RepID=A0ABD0LZ64_9CAEN
MAPPRSKRVRFATVVLLTVLLPLCIWRLIKTPTNAAFRSSLSSGTMVHQGVFKKDPDFKTYSKVAADTSSSLKESTYPQPFSISRFIKDGKDFPDLCKGPVGLPKARPVKKLDLTTFGPFEFLDNYRNPCWYTDDSTPELQCLPYFYQAGFPKCGSTYLYQLLCKHPDVAFTKKEPHWLTRIRFRNPSAGIKPYLSRYTKPLQRNPRKTSLVVGDASASTLFENKLWYLFPGNGNCSEPRILTVDYIRHLNPGVKTIVILRNPTSRLFSQYKYYKLQIKGLKSNREEFHEWAKEQVKLITDCFNEFGIRRCAYNATFTRQESCRAIIGIYYVYIQDWLLRFPRDQIYIVRLDDLSVNVTGEMTKIFAFLELVSAKRANVGTLSQTFGPILPATKSLLDDFYRPFNRRLAQLLGDEHFSWEDH